MKKPGVRSSAGAALLAFMLVLVTGSAWLFLSSLDRHSEDYVRRAKSGIALNQAKRALLSYAMNYPELRANPEKGPGFLPCPDRNNDGRPESNCAASTGTTLGRLPFTILGLDDPRDSSGERLWYALSPDFRNTRTTQAIINSETPGMLSVDGTGDIAALVMAPGPPVGSQYGRPGNDAADYLEGDNNNAGDGNFSTTAGNDQVAVITRAELMAVVEIRVINEIRAVLTRYRSGHSAYPWPAPFADPRVAIQVLRGAHTGLNNAAALTDSRKDFIALGVSPYDVVRNVTDGSIALVRSVSRRTLAVTGLAIGMENDFDRRDVYFIELRSLAHGMTGRATAGSGNFTLRDTALDFRQMGVVPGDLVENLSDGSIGRVSSIDSPTMLTVSGLGFGRQNRFSEHDGYRLPRYNGMKNNRKGLLPVHEPGKRFPAGFRVEWNVPGPEDSAVTGFAPGTAPGYAAAVTRLLRSSAIVGAVGVSGENGHCAWLNAHVVDCKGTSSAVPVLEGAATRGTTAAVLADSARDFLSAGINPGDMIDEPYFAVVTGVASATALNVRRLAAGSPVLAESANYRIRSATRTLSGITGAPGSDRLHDADRDFSAAGVRAGDVVENATDGSFGLVAGVGDTYLRTVLHGGEHNSFRAGDEYKVYYAYVNRRRYRFNLRYRGNLAVRSTGGMRQRHVCRGYGPHCDGAPGNDILPYYNSGIDSTAGPGSTGRSLADVSADFFRLGVVPGDTLFNTTDGSAGMVTAVRRRALEVGSLAGGLENGIDAGDGYRISRPLVVIEGLRDENVVTRTGLTILPGGAPGSVRTAGMDYYLSEAGEELPPWFLKNKWHHLLYVAYGAGFTPGGSGRCTAGADCLVLQGRADDSEALVVAAGMALAAQDRSSGSIADYYEGENTSLYGNDTFVRGGITAGFNDQVAVAAP